MPPLTRYTTNEVYFLWLKHGMLKNKKYDVLRRIVMNPVRETRKCLECAECYYYDKRMRSSIASTEDIVK